MVPHPGENLDASKMSDEAYLKLYGPPSDTETAQALRERNGHDLGTRLADPEALGRLINERPLEVKQRMEETQRRYHVYNL